MENLFCYRRPRTNCINNRRRAAYLWKTGTIYIGARNKARFEKRYGNLERVRFVSYDALKPLKLEIVPDYIIHGAGLASPELYTLMPVETILSNIDGIHELLHFAKNNPVERVLYISSSEVYGKNPRRNRLLKINMVKWI